MENYEAQNKLRVDICDLMTVYMYENNLWCDLGYCQGDVKMRCIETNEIEYVNDGACLSWDQQFYALLHNQFSTDRCLSYNEEVQKEVVIEEIKKRYFEIKPIVEQRELQKKVIKV